MAELAVAGDALSRAKDLLQTHGMAQAAEAEKLVQEHVAACQAKGDKDGQVEALKVLIDMHLAKKEFDEALQVADQAVGVLDDKSKKAKAMILLAQIHMSKSDDTQEAMSVLGKARAMYKEAGDRQGEVEVLGMIGQMHLGTGNSDMALRVAREALDISPDAPSALHIQAQISLANGNPTAAIEEATQMLSVSRSSGNKSSEASASLMLAYAMLAVDAASSEGLQCAREALAIFNELSDDIGTQSALHALANGYFARGDLEEGLKCAREALACFRRTGDKANEELLKATIEQARAMTAEYRKQFPKKPAMVAPTQQPPAGPIKCPIAESAVTKQMLDYAVAGRKYWGVPTQIQADPTIDAIDRAPSHTILWGMNLSDNSPTQVCVEFGDLVGVMAKGDVAKIPIGVLTCGVYARWCGEQAYSSITNVSAATIWGMARTVRQEIPQVIIQLLDFSEALTSAQISRCLRPPVGESAYYLGARWEPQMVAVSSLFRRDLKRDNLTGGGGGGSGQDGKKAARFMRKSFNWTGPSHKLDFCWYRQEWRAVGPPTGPDGPMPPPPPCRAMRSY